MGAYRRMHAVGADQKVALGTGAVSKMCDNRLTGSIVDTYQPFLEAELDVLAPGLVQDRFVERGAAHIHGGLTETLLHVSVDGAKPGAGLRIELEGFGHRTAADHLVGKADLGEHMHAVRRDLQAAADTGRVRPRLEQLRVDAGPLEEDSGDRTGDAGADDQGFAGRVGHVLLPMSLRVKKVQLLVILVAKISSD
jgi:hypothetical protein